MSLKGRVEQFSLDYVAGWIAPAQKSDVKILLELSLDGVVLQVQAADKYRPDLEAAGFGNGFCAFAFKLEPPLSPAEAARVKLRISGSDLCLELPRETDTSGSTFFAPNPQGLKVFIVGSPRSGTSVLLKAIQSVFELPGRGESHVIPALAQAVHSLNAYYRRFEDSEEDILIRQLPKRRFEQSLFSSVREFYALEYGDRGWVDKTPSDEAVHSAHLINQVFPDAKIIVTIRNGIEVVESYRKKFDASFEEACLNWSSVMDGIKILQQTDITPLIIDQFDFTNASDEVGRNIAAYLERPDFSENISQFFRGDRENKLSKHDWRLRLTLDDVDWSHDERDLFLTHCAANMEFFKYC